MSTTEAVAAALEGTYVPPETPSTAEQIAAEYLTPSRTLSSKWVDVLQPEVSLDVEKLSLHVSTPPEYDPRVRIHFTRKGLNGDISALQLRPSYPSQIGNMAMTRKVSKKKSNIKGSSGQMPFTPGGLDIQEQSSAADLHRSETGLLDTAPGLSRPMRFTRSDVSSADAFGISGNDESESEDDETSEEDEDLDNLIGEDVESVSGLASSKFDSIDSLLPPTSSFVRSIQQQVEEIPVAEKKWAHMVDINKTMANFSELVPNPAKTWPFELDNFQKEAVYHLEQGDSVFIAAHTSAGKTVVAEYAMSIAAQHMTKCIYTSPIKALSNQKYRDFKEEYGDVGILTGDVQLNPDASTLIMTTEILRSMLYNGADVIRDVEFIIFDEVHYVNDNERGVVWEEVIIMLPDHIKLVMLSATVPNTFEFANWVGRTKQKDVYVISTPKRPVPLKHYLWLKNQMLEVVDEHRQFLGVNYNKAKELIAPKPAPGASGAGGRGGSAAGSRGGARGGRGGGAARGGRGGSRGGGSTAQAALQRQMGPKTGRFNQSASNKNDMLHLIEFLRSKTLLPGVFFVFSRKMAEQYAQQLDSVQLNNAREKSQVYMFFDKACMRLRKEDRNLPQIEMLRQLLQQGIGLHHSGLLPIMKEVVEILFAKGLVKLLFATETFAMGLNLPTRTVVFTAVRKFDSKVMRDLTPGEYTQMAGRAGRRGLDSVGTVIIMNNSKDSVIPKASVENMVLGTPLKLSSQFRLTYNMILSLLRIEALKVEDVIQQSFSENAQFVLRPEREKQLLAITKACNQLDGHLRELVQKKGLSAEALELCRNYMSRANELRATQFELNCFLARMFGASIKHHFVLWRDDLALREVQPDAQANKHKPRKSKKAKGTKAVLRVGVIAYMPFFSPGDTPSFAVNYLGFIDDGLSMVPSLGSLSPSAIASFTIKQATSARRTVSMQEVELISDATCKNGDVYKYAKENIPLLFKGLRRSGINALNGQKLALKYEKFFKELQPLAEDVVKLDLDSVDKADLFGSLDALVTQERVADVLKQSKEASNTALLPEYEQRVNVLRQANYLDEGLNVALKGRVACEISTGYELYLTELIMDNFLGSYEPEEIVALLSAFVFEGARGAEDPETVTPKLDEGKHRLLELVDYVQKLAIENQVTLTQDEAEFGEKNRFALMQVVYEWARGMTFSEITQLTTVQEGLIVRVINRLDEICRSVMNAARIIGEVDLYDKLAIAQERIRRDIVFCSSLYL